MLVLSTVMRVSTNIEVTDRNNNILLTGRCDDDGIFSMLPSNTNHHDKWFAGITVSEHDTLKQPDKY